MEERPVAVKLDGGIISKRPLFGVLVVEGPDVKPVGEEVPHGYEHKEQDKRDDKVKRSDKGSGEFPNRKDQMHDDKLDQEHWDRPAVLVPSSPEYQTSQADQSPERMSYKHSDHRGQR